mgnify:CR=1 FL=1
MKRDFNSWFKSMKDNIATWDYYTDFKKIYKNVNEIKIELNILNSLIGSKNIEQEFVNIIDSYPNVIKVIPILLAKREKEIKINDTNKEYIFNFNKLNYEINEYVRFMRLTGLFDLLENHIINNLVDYVSGIEVGMDTNSRKNRTGDIMENLVEAFIVKAGYVKNKTYFKEMTKSEVERRFNLDLSNISNQGKTEKRFDFVLVKNNHIYACECNFYGSNGSKLNETARSYKTLALESKDIPNFSFVWFTDGKGWNGARHNLEETFDVLDTIYNLKDLEEGAIENL